MEQGMQNYPYRVIKTDPDIAVARTQAAKAWRYLRSICRETAREKWRELQIDRACGLN